MCLQQGVIARHACDVVCQPLPALRDPLALPGHLGQFGFHRGQLGTQFGQPHPAGGFAGTAPDVRGRRFVPRTGQHADGIPAVGINPRVTVLAEADRGEHTGNRVVGDCVGPRVGAIHRGA